MKMLNVIKLLLNVVLVAFLYKGVELGLISVVLSLCILNIINIAFLIYEKKLTLSRIFSRQNKLVFILSVLLLVNISVLLLNSIFNLHNDIFILIVNAIAYFLVTILSFSVERGLAVFSNEN